MSNILDPTIPSQILKVRPNGAAALNIIPTEGGQYSAGWETTSQAFTNGVAVWDFRNASANLALVTNLEAHVVKMAVATLATTGLRVSLQLFINRAYTVQSTTGATALTLTTNNCKLRTSYATTGVQMGFASGTTGITGGTLTADATPIRQSTRSIQDIVAASNANEQTDSFEPLVWTPTPFGGPIVLAQNEGLRIIYLVTTAAAVIISGSIDWSEIGTTVYP